MFGLCSTIVHEHSHSELIEGCRASLSHESPDYLVRVLVAWVDSMMLLKRMSDVIAHLEGS
jgi:hypothetical protein